MNRCNPYSFLYCAGACGSFLGIKAVHHWLSRLLSIALLIFCPLLNANTIDPALKRELESSIRSADSFEDRFDAEVWMVSMSEKLKRFISDPKERFRTLRLVHREATRSQLDPELVLAVIQIESAFNPYAVSHAGAQGMMQVMPFWKKEIGRSNDNLIDLETNLRYGCTILKHYLNREQGHFANALARYNGSYGSYKYSRKVIDAWLDYWR